MSDFEDEPQYDEDGVQVEQEVAEGVEPKSALEASILKGPNSYYYAHRKTSLGYVGGRVVGALWGRTAQATAGLGQGAIGLAVDWIRWGCSGLAD